MIHISFGSSSAKDKEGLHREAFAILERNQKNLKIQCPPEFKCFQRLIEEAHEKYNEKVVILIDEYDKPILDNIETPERTVEIRNELRDFYAVIKDSDRYIKFVFITGVSQFSKVSLFSGLNNLDDITINPRYATICGYTQRDVETVFSGHLKGHHEKYLSDGRAVYIVAIEFDVVKRNITALKWQRMS